MSVAEVGLAVLTHAEQIRAAKAKRRVVRNRRVLADGCAAHRIDGAADPPGADVV